MLLKGIRGITSLSMNLNSFLDHNDPTSHLITVNMSKKPCNTSVNPASPLIGAGIRGITDVLECSFLVERKKFTFDLHVMPALLPTKRVTTLLT